MEGKRRMNSVEDGGKEKIWNEVRLGRDGDENKKGCLVFLSGVPNKLDRNP